MILKILLLLMLKKVHIEFMNKREAKKLMKNSNLIDKKGIL